MRGTPRNDAPEHRPISTTPPKPRAVPSQPERVSASRYAKPKVLMGEVAAPKPADRGAEIASKREAFRTFMLSRHLRPTEWARTAGVAPGEIMAFLTGKSRNIAPETLEKLARTANCSPEDFFR